MRRLFPAILSALWLLAATGAALDWLFPPNLTRFVTLGTVYLDRADRPLALLPAPGGIWRFRTDSAAVAPVLRDLLIAVEDRRFHWHPGVDPIALVRAAVQGVRAGRVVSGGSTLAMQAARLLEPRPRTVRSKLIEIARALQLRARYGSAGVLDIWLTLAPFGGNLEGARAGAMAWFATPPEALEPAQAALLVAIPRRPEALRPDRFPAAATRERARVLAIGQNNGLFPVIEAPAVPTRRTALPNHAPQLFKPLPSGDSIATTLDLRLQNAVEALGQRLLVGFAERTSLALLVADIHDRDIRALFAGDWRNPARAGALDLSQAVRSPGSALKPFLYAMAFAEGLADPDRDLPDLPRRFGAYAPENFDRGFAGRVTAGEALRRSLNLPAVALLDRVGPLPFAAALRAGGADIRLPHGADPSLPLALGGVGVTLRQTLGLYAALADDGRGQALRLLTDAPAASTAFLPAYAAVQTANALTRPFPGGGPTGIAWKTGTSWGGRDGWAFGFDRAHAVGVWVGRPDGTPVPGLTGAAVALPILARVFDLLPPAPRAPPPPARIGPVSAETVTPTDALRLLFPPQGALLSADGPVTIRAMGGRRPLTFLVDGRPLDTEASRRQAGWRPPGPGFYRITVLDADGAAARAAVQVRQE